MDDADDATATNRGRSRRRVLAAAGTALGAALAGCGSESGDPTTQDDADDVTDGTATEMTDSETDTPTPGESTPEDEAAYPALGNYPVEGDTVTYGFLLPQSGPYSTLGVAERRGYELAVTHLNDGGGWADSWDVLSGSGVLGRSVEAAVGDTETDPGVARQVTERLIDEDGAIMLSGGVSTAVAIVTQQQCQAENVPYMAGMTPLNVVTGEECVRYGFREMANVAMLTRGLVSTLVDALGGSGTVSVLYPDYAYGNSVQETTTRLFEERGWSTGETVAAPLGTADFRDYLDSISRAETDVLVLSQYGPRGGTALQQATELGFAEDTTLAVPQMEGTYLDTVGPEHEGVYGTVDWHWSREDAFSTQFTTAYESEYGERPSAAARLAYAATMRYSAAVERAETFYPPEVIRAMEDHEYGNTGIGQARSRACDHQSIRPVFVTRGQNPETADAPVEIVATQGADTVGYACTEGPAAECDLGDYE